MHSISLQTQHTNQLIDITDRIEQVIQESGVREGICLLFVPHTTAAITINEAADPSVAQDISNTLKALVPRAGSYAHLEGNADSHIKSVMVGPSIGLIISRGKMVLGRWQGVFFCEFDGPRTRQVLVEVISK